jgi:phosphohistidine phosphatase SixA
VALTRIVAVWTAIVVAAGVGGVGAIGQGPRLSASQLVAALRGGGYVLVMRHANAPAALPNRTTARPGNVALERQLSDAGIRGATEMGRVLRSLGVSIGSVWVSPTFRARETAERLAFPNPAVAEDLGEGAASMADPLPGLVQALLARAATVPQPGTNTILVTHSPNIGGAFPAERPAVAEGEVFVVRPDGRGGHALVARVLIDEWTALAERR